MIALEHARTQLHYSDIECEGSKPAPVVHLRNTFVPQTDLSTETQPSFVSHA